MEYWSVGGKNPNHEDRVFKDELKNITPVLQHSIAKI
jgi:hypothetical protein